MLKCPATMQ